MESSLRHTWQWQISCVILSGTGEELRKYVRAIELNPRYPTARHWYGELLTILGRFDEALKEIELAKNLDPLSLIINAVVSRTYYYVGEYAKAIELAKETLEMDPNFRPVRLYLAFIYNSLGMHDEVLRELELLNQEGVYTGVAYAKLGRISEAKRVLEDLIRQSQKSYIPNYDIATLHFHIGDNDTGFAYLEKSYEEREYQMTFLKIDPYLEENVRTDPRFKALLKKMNLE